MPLPLKWFRATALMAATLMVPASLAAQELTTRCDPPPGSLGRLTRAQKKAFTDSQDMFIAGRYSDALVELRSLLAEVPRNSPTQAALAERAAEAALEAGYRAYAISVLKPIEEHHGGDCAARTLLARAYAENGQPAERDAEITALTALHKQSPESAAGKLDMFLLERHTLKDGGSVAIGYALRPFGPHNTHLSAEICDASGSTILRMELDSDDGDQVYFRETHPELAAKGDRRFSLDIFGPDSPASHALIQFFDGEPSYDTVRERILTIAERSGDAQRGSN